GNIVEQTFFGLEQPPTELVEKRIPSSYPLSPDSGEYVLDQILTEKPYPIKASWIQSTNTFVTEANPRRVYQAFKKIGFNVVVDLFITPTIVAFADIVLPAVTYVERDGIIVFPPPFPYFGAINKAVDPIEDGKSDMEIILELGKRLNPDAWPWRNVNEWFDNITEPLGITFEELREMGAVYQPYEYKKYEKGLLRSDGNLGFNTPTGKVELYSTVFERVSLDPLPYYEEPPESPISAPQIAKNYPLILTTGGRVNAFFHSEHRQIPVLRQLNPNPIVEIHPETAKQLGIEDGDWVLIENKYGRCKQKAKLTTGVHPKVVHAQHGWWYPEKPASEPILFGVWESNINLLIPSGWTGKSGYGYPFKNLLCKVYKAEEPENV
ncbi:MAG: molybdopterin dinucleotide binding domain-containing protein, partial [Candidatus Bathyarchaeia archaeon]